MSGRTIKVRLIATVVCLAASYLAVGPSPAQGRAGDILVGTDGAGASVVRVNPNTGAVSPVASGSPLVTPSGLDFSRNGFLFEADYGLPGIVRINPRTGNATNFASGPPFYSEPLDVEIGPDGKLYVAEQADGFEAILRVNKAGVTTPISPGGLLTDPYAIAIRHRDLIAFVADGESGNVIRVNLANGAQKLVSDDPAMTDLKGIALSPAGKLFVFNDGDDTIYRVSIATGAATPVATSASLANGYNIAFETRGTLVAGSLTTDQVARVNTKTGSVSLIGAVTNPEGITVEPPRCGGKLATIVGSTGKDVLRGSKFADVFVGLGAKDRILGGRGADIICGGTGRDRLVGGAGRDLLIGGKNPDTCIGGAGTDTFKRC